MADLIERLFPDAGHAETALILTVLAFVSLGVWFGRKRLSVTVPVAVAVLLLAATTIPSCIPAHGYARRATCINNLKLIENAKSDWAAANSVRSSDAPLEQYLFGPDLKLKMKPTCPSGGTYSLGNFGEKPRCSWEARGHKLE
jgi:hypothetical protein